MVEMPEEDEVQPPRTFMERRRWDPRDREYVAGPLSERMPDYIKEFARGAAIIVAVGLGIFLISSARLEHAIGYTAIAAGTAMLLVGGARGGGYSNIGIGAVEALVGRRNRQGDGPEEDADLRHDPMARLRRGLRPPPNPSAFWTTIAGFLYIALGVPFTL
jgi:hypothetical protein